MAPTPTSNQTAHTPSSKSAHAHFSNSRTPQSKHRLNFNPSKPSPNPKEKPPADHPVEVIGRIRSYPDRAFKVSPDNKSLMVRTDVGYRDFRLDGISLSEEDDLDGFYRKFVESRINGVKLGNKCTIMMYGPTGSGKSHTMFGCPKQPGIVYKSLKDILGGEGGEENESGLRIGTFVQVTVLEIYNEEIYDLLSSGNGGGLSLGCPKGGASKVKLEVMGKKAKNATYICGSDAAKISKEIQKVEKRRIVKSTFCNERSSRSHCMIILDVPTVGGRLMLVDMAGSENIEQAGQTGLEAKMQTAKINQGNISLKRVVESIANGDSHVPFRDSKLTMLLQDSFEDDKSKILMVLCVSPDPKEMHKTICTLEYGAKAKCIIRGPHTPETVKICSEDSSSAVVLGSRIAAMDQFILKLQKENKLREQERNEAHKQLMKREEEVSALRAKLSLVEGKGFGESEEEINLKVSERTQMLKVELENKLQECQNLANDFLQLEKKKMEERILQQQHELEVLRRRLAEMESELHRSRDRNNEHTKTAEFSNVGNFAKKLLDVFANEDPGMEKSMDLVRSMDLDADKRESFVSGVKILNPGAEKINRHNLTIWDSQNLNRLNYENRDTFALTSAKKMSLSTVLEKVEEHEEHKENSVDEEVQKEVIEEKTVYPTIPSFSSQRLGLTSGSSGQSPQKFGSPPDLSSRNRHIFGNLRDVSDGELSVLGIKQLPESSEDSASSRRVRIQNIFTLCGNYRELSHQSLATFPSEKRSEKLDSCSSPVRTIEEDAAGRRSSNKVPANTAALDSVVNKQKVMKPTANQIHGLNEGSVHLKENYNPLGVGTNDLVQVHVKWEVSKEYSGKFITTLEISKDASLADLRKLIEMHLGADKQDFTFLLLGVPSGAPVPREKEATLHASKLPVCTQLQCHLACLRLLKGTKGPYHHLPLSPINNILAAR